MKVFLTGGSGHLGSWTARELTSHGWHVVNADQFPPNDADAADAPDLYVWRELDLTDVGQVAGAMAGCDAVIHLGAIPAPGRRPDDLLFRTNTGATFAVLYAASLLGVRRAVIASSISALEPPTRSRRWTTLTPQLTRRTRSCTKTPTASQEVDEHTAEMFVRRTGMTVLAYRFHWVARPEEAGSAAARLVSDPAEMKHNLWGYVDVRDAARACRLGIESDVQGFEAFNIIAADTLASEPTADLIKRLCPQTKLRAEIEGCASAFSTEKAARLLGYVPQHTWRNEQAQPPNVEPTDAMQQ
ncbi:MAG: NAD(P)-dependent oxidoreductase [Chloroflexia bacterium]